MPKVALRCALSAGQSAQLAAGLQAEVFYWFAAVLLLAGLSFVFWKSTDQFALLLEHEGNRKFVAAGRKIRLNTITHF